MLSALLALAAVLPALAVASLDASSTLLWPVPQSVQCVDGPSPVNPEFGVNYTTPFSNGTILAAAVARCPGCPAALPQRPNHGVRAPA